MSNDEKSEGAGITKVDRGQLPGLTTRVVQMPTLGDVAPSSEACLMVIYGARLGQRITLQECSLVIGRDPDVDISLSEDSVSRRHALVAPTSKGVLIRDLDSTNGTYINHQAVQEALLKNGDLIKIGRTIFKFLDSGNLEGACFEEIYQMTIMDGLTQIHNRRYLLETMERELSRCRRHERPLSMLIFDIDHFKRVNDDFGHLTGDYVLRELALAVSKRVRREEVFARYGGEEFVILLPETALLEAHTLAEQVRCLIEQHAFAFEGKQIEVTVSVGVAELEAEMESPAELTRAADRCLYQAKSSGRNCVMPQAARVEEPADTDEDPVATVEEGDSSTSGD